MRRILVSLLVFCSLGATAANAQFINIVSGGTTGVYYPLGQALERIYAKALPGSRIQHQSTAASVENLNLLESGRAEIALTLGDTLSLAWKGDKEAGFAGPLQKLRGVSAFHSNYIQIVASAESGIKTLADLKGKRVSVGSPRSGTELNARAIFPAAGIDYNGPTSVGSVLGQVQFLPFGQSVDLMKNRQLDATLISAGLGVAAVRDLAASVDIVLIPVPADVVAKVGDPAYVVGTVPANTYRGQTTAISTARIANFLVTREGVSADVVYQMTKAMFENLQTMIDTQAAAKEIKLETATAGMPVPLHPGAERYYREKGIVR
ncbi:MAG: TAXI family TRAP transporter solute-binding subunit [Rhodospirillales bacterium]|nr:TAXI family TRAP transporter solute-binding subunit [Rhodospirillales bacterium]